MLMDIIEKEKYKLEIMSLRKEYKIQKRLYKKILTIKDLYPVLKKLKNKNLEKKLKTQFLVQ